MASGWVATGAELAPAEVEDVAARHVTVSRQEYESSFPQLLPVTLDTANNHTILTENDCRLSMFKPRRGWMGRQSPQRKGSM